MLEWLKTILGDSYTEEIDKKVSDQIGKSFVSKTDFNTLNETKKTLEKAVSERDGQLEELKKVDAAGLQAKIIELQTANTTAKTEYETEIKKLKLDSMLETRLIKEGAVNTKAVKALLDASKISIDNDNIIGLDDQLTALKESEKWAFNQQAPGKTGREQGGGKPPERTVTDDITDALFGETE